MQLALQLVKDSIYLGTTKWMRRKKHCKGVVEEATAGVLKRKGFIGGHIAHENISRGWRDHDEGTDGVDSIREGDQGRCSIKAKAHGMDRMTNLVFPEHIPAGTDLEGRIRRIWLYHRSQQVLLSSPCWLLAFRSNSVVRRLMQCPRITGFRCGELFLQDFLCTTISFAQRRERPDGV